MLSGLKRNRARSEKASNLRAELVVVLGGPLPGLSCRGASRTSYIFDRISAFFASYSAAVIRPADIMSLSFLSFCSGSS